MKTTDKPQGPLVKFECEVEAEIAKAIKAMEAHTKMPLATLVNTALKRFVSQHKDYLPEDYEKKKAV